MQTNTNRSITLPPPIAAYFAADTTDADRVARCFTESVTADFPGSPVDLRYRFTLEGDTIARLEITT
jgi:hypothetical protein